MIIFAWAELDKSFQFSELIWLILGIAIVMYEEILSRIEILFRRNHNE